jgi:hypothetical protein
LDWRAVLVPRPVDAGAKSRAVRTMQAAGSRSNIHMGQQAARRAIQGETRRRRKENEMRRSHLLTALLVALAGSGAVQAQTIYKFIGPDGVVEYSSSQPPAGTKIISETAATSLTPAQRDALERQRLANASQGATVDALIKARIKRMNDADAAILAAQKQLQLAEQALQDGRESEPGERRGTVSGHARVTDEYMQRLTTLEQAVTDARQRLDQAYLARNNL